MTPSGLSRSRKGGPKWITSIPATAIHRARSRPCSRPRPAGRAGSGAGSGMRSGRAAGGSEPAPTGSGRGVRRRVDGAERSGRVCVIFLAAGREREGVPNQVVTSGPGRDETRGSGRFPPVERDRGHLSRPTAPSGSVYCVVMPFGGAEPARRTRRSVPSRQKGRSVAVRTRGGRGKQPTASDTALLAAAPPESPVPRRLLAVATRLFADKGFDRTSVQEIVAAAEVTKGAMYHYFDSKDDLLAEVYARVLRLQMQRLEAVAAEGGPVQDRVRRAAADVVVTTIANL